MTEYAGKSNEELASAFIVGTCRLIPGSSLVYVDHMHNLLASKDPVPTDYAILCGSFAEFYIRQIIPCIGDVDILCVEANQLVFSGELIVLPSDMSSLPDWIMCFRIEPNDRYPGFGLLRVWGELIYNWKYHKYEFNYIADTDRYARIELHRIAARYHFIALDVISMPNIVSGPAIKRRSTDATEFFMGTDFVRSMWCPLWPKEANGWLNRPRNNEWPTIDTITEVVQNGCHVVSVKHPSCRNDETEWRFSFSFAEIILLQSWTQTQQLVYHLLRFFAKRELIQKDCRKEDEVLCPYHLKTLMLWTCEEMSAEWWNSYSVIAICSELLKILAKWLKTRHCPNYFIPEANLFHYPPSSNILKKTQKQLHKFSNSEILCNWFVENYILSFIRGYFKPRGKMPHFVHYILPLLESWNMRKINSLDFYLIKTITFSHNSCRSLLKIGLKSGIRQRLGNNLLELRSGTALADLSTIQNDLCFTYCDISLHTLHIAYGLICEEMSWDGSLFVEFVNAISVQPNIIRSQYHNFPKTYRTKSSRFQFLRAKSLMENLTGANSRSEFHLLSLLTKQFLTKALKHDDAISNGIVPAVLSYLAALHFATSEYKEATGLCSAVLVDETSKEEKETLSAGCLLFIDDVARIVGLCVLRKKITEGSLHYISRRLYLDLRLSPEVFAQHLSLLSAERMSKQLDSYNEFPDLSFSMDVHLKALMKLKYVSSTNSGSIYNAARQIVYRRPGSLTETEASNANPSMVKERLLEILMEHALVNMTSFYVALRKDFDVECNTGDCYRALYLYKCRQYDDVVHLCEQILKECDLQDNLKEFTLTNVLLLPALDSFYDRDVQSLLGFYTLFYYLSPLNANMWNIELTDDSTFEHWFARYVFHKKHELVTILRRTYFMKCQYFLGRHFLASYLKLRCHIDCDIPYSGVLAEFAVQKTNLPFERIIHRFISKEATKITHGFQRSNDQVAFS